MPFVEPSVFITGAAPLVDVTWKCYAAGVCSMRRKYRISQYFRQYPFTPTLPWYQNRLREGLSLQAARSALDHRPQFRLKLFESLVRLFDKRYLARACDTADIRFRLLQGLAQPGIGRRDGKMRWLGAQPEPVRRFEAPRGAGERQQRRARLFGLLVDQRRVGQRPGRCVNGCQAGCSTLRVRHVTVELLIDLFGDVRQDGRGQLENCQQCLVERGLRGAALPARTVVQPALDPLQVVIAERTPEEALGRLASRSILVVPKALGRPCDQPLEPGEQRAIRPLQIVDCRL